MTTDISWRWGVHWVHTLEPSGPTYNPDMIFPYGRLEIASHYYSLTGPIRKANDGSNAVQADMDLAARYIYTGDPLSACDILYQYFKSLLF